MKSVRISLNVSIALCVAFISVFIACQSTQSNTTVIKAISKQSSKPNVIVIMADDMGWSDIGCYGSEVPTPNLDRMASNGMRFTQMYNTAKCNTSRAALLTGLYAQQTNYHLSYKQPMSNAITLGELFKMAGYTTMWSGKHHSTERPTTRGFDHYSGLFEGACNFFNPGAQREGEGQPAQKRPDRPWVLDGEFIQPYTPPKDFYTTDAFTDYALTWLDDHPKEDPFFLYMAYTAPHDPLMAWPADIEKYRGKYMEGYEAIRKSRFQKQKDLGLIAPNYPISEASFQDWNALSKAEKIEEDLKMAVYGAMIDRLDQNIGRLMEKIKEMGVSENTLILFLSDNGASSEVVKLEKGSGEIGSLTRWTSLGGNWANVSNVPYRLFKNYSQEGGIKTPLIAYWPAGIKDKNSISHTPLHLVDLMSTFVDLTGVEYPQEYNDERIIPQDGISFLPILKGNAVKRDQPLFWQWKNGKAIRDGDWKLVSLDNEWRLHNLINDPVEEIDLSSDNPEKFEELKSKYLAWEGKFEM
ncbi:MAG: arylsulfatase A-like enzyme [Saprospiraceae bacterium]|jgi:arylsulfatase A-like enzyme